MKTLFIVDDHEMIRIGLKNWIETRTDWKVSDEASSAAECFEKLKTQRPAVILIDVDLGTESGFDLIPVLKKNYPDVKILMYSMFNNPHYVAKAEELGAQGYISKSADNNEFKKGLDAVYGGGLYLEKSLAVSKHKLSEVASILTKKEYLIFQEIICGKTNEEICAELKIKKRTLEVYISLIYEKTFSKSRADLMKKFL